ncbi:MAG: CoB--CoM heterodisulfide reductase iron-sulfur subunit B family protein [Anaerolineaceae bacterium]
MKYGYYPGCSLEKNAASYHVSAMAAIKPFGIEFVELDDWNCCGATEYISLNLMASYALIARNLAIAAKTADANQQIVAPCSACYLNLSKTEKYLTESPSLTEKVNIALKEGGLSYKPGNMRVRHLLDIVVNDIGYDAIASKVTKPLKGLRVAPYYGCMIVRPSLPSQFDDPEYPVTLDKLMQVLGATVIDYPMKAHCCGGHMTQISQATGLELIRQLLQSAADYETDVIVTLCPMCQLNLDAYQSDVNKYFKTKFNIPILYFTQLMGLAMGIEARDLGIGKEFIDARPALAKIGVEVPETAKKKPSKEELPMPKMPEEV